MNKMAMKKYKHKHRYITEIARKLRQNMTDSEKKLWEHLSNKKLNGLRFRRQHPIGRYIVDFYNHENKIAIEVDGDIHDKQKSYDKNRDEYLLACGYTVIRFTNDEIEKNIDKVIERITNRI